jgi:hypothetical protein
MTIIILQVAALAVFVWLLRGAEPEQVPERVERTPEQQ